MFPTLLTGSQKAPPAFTQKSACIITTRGVWWRWRYGENECVRMCIHLLLLSQLRRSVYYYYYSHTTIYVKKGICSVVCIHIKLCISRGKEENTKVSLYKFFKETPPSHTEAADTILGNKKKNMLRKSEKYELILLKDLYYFLVAIFPLLSTQSKVQTNKKV